MENNVPNLPDRDSGGAWATSADSATAEPGHAAASGPLGASAVDRAVDRRLERRRAVARAEVERLVEAAFRLISETGTLEPKVSVILAEAGLSNQAFYRHFESKHALLVAVLDEGIRRLADYLSARMRESQDPVEATRAWIRGMAAQSLDPAGAQATRPFALARGRLAESFPEEVSRSEDQITAPLRAALEEARRTGRMPEVDASQEAEALYHLMMGWVEARLVEGRIPAEREVDRLESFILAGLQRGASLGGASILRESRSPASPSSNGEVES